MSRLCRPWIAAWLALLTSLASAQYKLTDANGRVTYTDRPPAASSDNIQPMRPTGGAATGTSLPYALRQTAARYPVTLYSADDCEACILGRNLLRQRGIPYIEKTVKTDADIAAFRRAEASGELPLLRIGAQQVKGYNEAAWVSYLEAAGYPKQSALPPDYRQPEATPLVEPKAAAIEPGSSLPPPAAAALPPALEKAPDGIRF